MKIRFLFILMLLAIGFTINSCQRDDICAEATPTTPRLVIQFFDIEDRGESKVVNSLSVRAQGFDDLAPLNMDGDTIRRTDSIAIPLNTASTVTNLIFTRNTNDSMNENRDELQFSYTPQDEYVNRACGFRTNFLDFQFDFNFQDTENWIQDIDIIEPDVTDELTTHLFIFH